jgi:hypothetical protein
MLNKKAFLLSEEGSLFGFLLCFTPYDHLPPVTGPVVVVVVIMVLLIIIF